MRVLIGYYIFDYDVQAIKLIITDYVDSSLSKHLFFPSSLFYYLKRTDYELHMRNILIIIINHEQYKSIKYFVFLDE